VDELVTPRGVKVAPWALRFEFARSGGPGGQHVNTTASKATAVLDVAAGLPDHLARPVMERWGPILRVSSTTHRSQGRNKAEATDRLLARIDAALERPPSRTSTRVPPREKRKRLDDKSRRSRKLGQRRISPDE
jgi:ribosome-associated protein